jgi:hypothetical protein
VKREIRFGLCDILVNLNSADAKTVRAHEPLCSRLCTKGGFVGTVFGYSAHDLIGNAAWVTKNGEVIDALRTEKPMRVYEFRSHFVWSEVRQNSMVASV